ncbi:MAG TPA: glycoside hydrolase family 38 C-terminal domain-containing protein, partial [Candidatus Dormibacteraeota bacterium]|nr:glycoside hydrolase family 38 C-terminal domain-containing protein [Candidatus Dormibacteraeota bacterium]
MGISEGTKPGASLRVVLYHHTHWDREWWTTFQAFRARLVAVVDRLIDAMEADPAFTRFHLDGQCVVLRDYLEVRPERRERLRRLIDDGRIAVGPWYVLADHFLTSGEAAIRNLWLGERTARALGVRCSPVGYLPDQFGHVGQMPQLLAGFGIDAAIVWRGFGGPPPDMRSEFWWEAPDGTRVLGVYLPQGYYRSHIRPDTTDDQALERSRRFVEDVRPYATTGLLLEPYGGDHLTIDPALPERLDALAGDDVEYVLGTPADYVRMVRDAGVEPDVVWHGEGRAFGRRAHLLPGVLSARLHLKRANHDVQTRLERYAEPLQAQRWLLGGRYEAEHLWLAWELLVQNHPHDSICGCSIDQVHREMVPRFDQAGQIAELLAAEALEELAGRVDTGDLPAGAEPIVVHNPLNWERSETATVLLAATSDVRPATWRLLDDLGLEVPFQARRVVRDDLRYETADWWEVAFPATVSGLGWRRYHLERRAEPLDRDDLHFTVLGDVARTKGAEETSGLRVGPGRMENERLAVTVGDEDGTLTVEDRASGLVWRGLNALRDDGEAGDTYNHAWPLGDQRLGTSGLRPRLAWLEVGPARATLRVTREWALPEGLTGDRLNRSARTVPVTVHSDVTLHAHGRRVEVRTHLDNTVRDHRMQALFPLGAAVATASAEGVFEVAERPAVRASQRGGAEPAVPEQPQQRFCSVTDGERGLTVAVRGLPEFAAEPDGTLAVTLLRAVGWLSRDDLLTRVRGAGPQRPTPDAQMLGPVEAEYAIVPHAGGWEAAG